MALFIRDRDRIDRCKKKLIDLVTNFNPNGTSRYNLVFELTHFALQNRKNMSDTIHDLASTLDKEYHFNYSKADYDGAIQFATWRVWIGAVQA